MIPQIQHKERFDAAGKLDADDWVILPHDALKSNFALDGALADEMVRVFIESLSHAVNLPVRSANEPEGIRLRTPMNKTALILSEPERIVDAQRAETSWRISGGFLLAHRVDYGGRFYIGAEWQPDHSLKLYSTIRRFPMRFINWFGVARGIAVYSRTQGRVYDRVQKNFLNQVAHQITSA